jgi:hypothetical protein
VTDFIETLCGHAQGLIYMRAIKSACRFFSECGEGSEEFLRLPFRAIVGQSYRLTEFFLNDANVRLWLVHDVCIKIVKRAVYIELHE